MQAEQLGEVTDGCGCLQLQACAPETSQQQQAYLPSLLTGSFSLAQEVFKAQRLPATDRFLEASAPPLSSQVGSEDDLTCSMRGNYMYPCSACSEHTLATPELLADRQYSLCRKRRGRRGVQVPSQHIPNPPGPCRQRILAAFQIALQHPLLPLRPRQVSWLLHAALSVPW